MPLWVAPGKKQTITGVIFIMKNEKIYSLFMRMYNNLPECDRVFIDRHIAENAHGASEYDNYYSGNFKLVFAECFRVVTLECNCERDRKNKTIPMNFIKSIITECKTDKFKPYESKGKFYVASEGRGFEFLSVPESIEHDTVCNFDLKSLIDDVATHSKEELELPGTNEFISLCNIAKKTITTKAFKSWYHSPYCFGMNMPSIQIAYLYDVLKHLNNPKIYMTWTNHSSNVKVNPLYIEFNGGRGVIMPMRSNRDERGCKNAF